MANPNLRMVDMNPGTVGRTATGPAATASRFRDPDTSRDGWLSRSEARGDAEIHAAWSRLDAAGDGRISPQEFAQVHTGTAR